MRAAISTVIGPLETVIVTAQKRSEDVQSVPMPYEVQSLEVLRGRQGTLYGASSLGGLIKYVTRSPDLTQLGHVGRATLSTLLRFTAGRSWGPKVHRATRRKVSSPTP